LKVLEVLKLASEHLGKHGSESARLDAEVMLARSLGLRRLDLYLQFDRPLSESELSAYRAQVARRAHGEPVAYVVGHKEFMALDFEVTPAVLVPNPDTEVLVQMAVAWAREAGRPLRVADVGTGSGCIAVAVAHYAQDVEIWAGDLSSQALEVAARNVARHSLEQRVHLVCGDLMEPLPGTFDLVCANLPYLAAGAGLPAEVLSQPSVALYAGGDGAELVSRLLEAAPARLNPGGRVLVEVDPSILTPVLEVADRHYGGRRIHRDLGGHERVLEAWS
jgi:protein-(glutamine-N5) methyltransferase, release factor-specific